MWSDYWRTCGPINGLEIYEVCAQNARSQTSENTIKQGISDRALTRRPKTTQNIDTVFRTSSVKKKKRRGCTVVRLLAFPFFGLILAHRFDNHSVLFSAPSLLSFFIFFSFSLFLFFSSFVSCSWFCWLYEGKTERQKARERERERKKAGKKGWKQQRKR